MLLNYIEENSFAIESRLEREFMYSNRMRTYRDDYDKTQYESINEVYFKGFSVQCLVN